MTPRLREKYRRIYLIGMMGSGKSHWAKRLGKHTGLPAFDLDNLLEEQAGKTVRELFAAEGEAAFRQAESAMLREGVPAESFILACGGGTPCFHDNMDFMKTNGLVIWLNPGYDELVKRLAGGIDSRPVLQGVKSPEALKAHLDNLMHNRLQWYQQAHIIIGADQPTISDLLKKIEEYEQAP